MSDSEERNEDFDPPVGNQDAACPVEQPANGNSADAADKAELNRFDQATINHGGPSETQPADQPAQALESAHQDHTRTSDLGRGSASSNPPMPAAVVRHPDHIGRYQVQKVLGEGGFGLVYLCHDEQLDRRVALKVPHAHLVSRPQDAAPYLAEARTVAGLDHPHIVPVYDVGCSEEFPCYVVSKYIEGTDLAASVKQSRLRRNEAAELVATVAEALDHAHRRGLVHRDVKPGNILIDLDGNPHVVDFGLALREQDIGKGPKWAGTPTYMSPEQARGEGHRVDARSDIFSLGVIFYELLAGRRPFQCDKVSELLEQITGYEPRPPRQFHASIPKELERICFKAMMKKASERYSTSKDMADDLRAFIADHQADGSRDIQRYDTARPLEFGQRVGAINWAVRRYLKDIDVV